MLKLLKMKLENEQLVDEGQPGGGEAPAPALAEPSVEDSAPPDEVDAFLDTFAKEAPPATPQTAAPEVPAPATAEEPAPAPAPQPETPQAQAQPQPAPQPAAQPQAQPQAQAPAPTPLPIEPLVAPVAAQPQAPAPTPAPTPPTAEEQNVKREEMRKAYVSDLAKRYEIPKEQHDALLTSPESVLPAYAAEVHARAVDDAIKAITSALPTFIERVLEHRQVQSQAETEFFDKWPDLKPHKNVVGQITQAYVAANPGVSREQAMTDIGLIAMTKLRIPFNNPGTPAQAPAPAVQMTPPPPPAMPGGGGHGLMSRAQPTQWEKLAQELFTDD